MKFKHDTQNPVLKKIGDTLAVGTALAVTATPAFAAAPEAPDVGDIVTYIGYATAAVIAIGSAKLIPAAAMWLYTSLSNMAKRG